MSSMKKKIGLYIKKEKKMIITFIIYSIANSLFITLVSFFAKEIVNSMIVKNDTLVRNFIFYTMFGVVLIAIAYFTKNSYMNRVCEIVTNLQKDLFGWVKRADIYSTRELDTGEIITSITSDIKKIYTFFCEDFSGIIDSVLVFLIMSAACLYFNKVLFVFTLACSIINGIAIFFVKKIEYSEHIIRRSEKNIKSLNLQLFKGLPIIDLFSGTKILLQKCINEVKVVGREENKKVKLESIYALLSWGSNMIREVGIIVIAPLVLKLDLGSTMAIINVSSYLNATLATLGECILNTQQVNVAYKHLVQISEMPCEKRDKFEIDDIREIALWNVSYSYDNKNMVIKDVSFKIQTGSYVAIMGEIGAGKSTLLKILLGFLSPQEGIITVNGESLTERTVYKLREYVSYVDQESSMFEGTILENLCGFKEDRYSKEQIDEVLKRVNLKNWIENLENGVHTNIGQKGLKLSGGERQRLSIARAILKDSQFLIIDEPTSALDQENEKLIQNIIETERLKRGIVVVTHSPEFVANADYIFNLKTCSYYKRK